jgi:hypothetical protein
VDADESPDADDTEEWPSDWPPRSLLVTWAEAEVGEDDRTVTVRFNATFDEDALVPEVSAELSPDAVTLALRLDPAASGERRARRGLGHDTGERTARSRDDAGPSRPGRGAGARRRVATATAAAGRPSGARTLTLVVYDDHDMSELTTSVGRVTIRLDGAEPADEPVGS